jgi:chromate transporter
VILLELFIYFAVISMLAFGGGNAVISLLERISVERMQWVTSQDFAAAIGFAYITPGPV